MSKHRLITAFVTMALVLAFACAGETPVPPTDVPTAVPTGIPDEQPATEAPTLPSPTEVPLPTEPPPTEAVADGLSIVFFDVEIEDTPTGKRLTFTWQTTGAAEVIIWSGTKHRFPDAWEGPPNGSLVKELTFTYYRNPSMMLVAYGAGEDSVSKSVVVEWPCEYDYFFPADIARCPSGEASATWAAEQPFEHGRMIWLEEVSSGALATVIFVLYEDGQFALYEDTWTEGLPESDPSIVPPAGLLQPTHGFGKLWRENASVRDKLGWATAQEKGFNTMFQAQIAESIGATAFLRALDGKIVRVSGWDVGTGSWEYAAP